MTQGADPVSHVFLEPLQISAEAPQKIPTAWDKYPTAWDKCAEAPLKTAAPPFFSLAISDPIYTR